MADVHDVAAYILQKQPGGMTTWKLQKLVYYSQAWNTVWTGEPLFADRIEAWANGPVVTRLYREHRGEYSLAKWSGGDPSRLSERDRRVIDAVLEFYGDKSGQWLSELTHAEKPWLDARAGLSPSERGNKVITPEALAAYYGSLS
jgi:uncharacterized phage-associated protein